MSRETAPHPLVTTDLIVGGMTCAACVRRVEKKLGAFEGVRATVNLATGTARVEHPSDLGTDALVAAVEKGGYTARLPEPPASGKDRDDEATGPGVPQRLLVTALLAVPVLVLSMVPSLQFRNWQWLCFVLAAPVAFWSAWPFHERAWRGLRHGAATMDTLVSLGILASFGWSSYSLFLGGAGCPRHADALHTAAHRLGRDGARLSRSGGRRPALRPPRPPSGVPRPARHLGRPARAHRARREGGDGTGRGRGAHHPGRAPHGGPGLPRTARGACRDGR